MMPVSDKLAYEIYIILIFHIPAILLLTAFCFYIFFKAKKSAMLFSFFAVAAMLEIWMVSKVLKTVAYDASLRWLFIVIQYFGVQFMGYFLIIFAYVYTKNKAPSKKFLILTGIYPLFSFIIVMTNPLHMLFYSYYDFYRDRFGPLFLPLQTVQYVYLFIGVIMLSRRFTSQPGFKGRKGFARFFAAITLIPLAANCYYILFKLDIFDWIFPFPIFDFSPIAGAAALILFIIPALKFRFFDISAVSYRQIFNQMPTGMVFLSPKGFLFSPNKAFCGMFPEILKNYGLDNFLSLFEAAAQNDIKSFIIGNDEQSSIFKKNDGRYCLAQSFLIQKEVRLLSFSDVTEISMLEYRLSEKNEELVRINSELLKMSEKASELCITKIKAAVAQNLHDILGHSLTVALCTAELAEKDNEKSLVMQKLEIIYNLLSKSLDDLKTAVQGNKSDLSQTSLTKAIRSLDNPGISLELVSQGTPYELDTAKTEAVFRICQEAVTNSIKHGKASKTHIFLRFFSKSTDLYIIDNGIGCRQIKKGYGLSGMEARMAELGGIISFGSDESGGFFIHVTFQHDES